MVNQTRAIDQARLIEFIGGLPKTLTARVDAAPKLPYGIRSVSLFQKHAKA